ncbi:MAG: TetR/AcrR family transcriptional regulator [Burkholderiaceae bacterium]|nr:TetR/AcrR family transcriptional regulator [Burkholderiaceae bacterium]
MDTKVSAPQTRRFLRKREAILDAAARQFNRDGVRGATLAGVAQSVGLITNSITYYYRRKEDLASACFLRAIGVVTELAHEAARHESAAARITHFVSGWYAIQRDIARQARPELVSFNEVRTLPPSHSGAVFDAYNDMFRAVRGLLGKASAGTFLRTQLNARTHLLLSLTMWVRLLVRRHEPDDYDLVACRVCDILLNGLAAPGARWRDDAPALEMPISRVEAAGAAAAPDPAALDFLRAATALINEQGYRGASVDRISARLNVTKGSFYHHHVTKDDLVFACFEHSFATIRLANAHARAYPGSGWDRLGLASRMLVRHQLSRRGPLLRVTAWSALPPDLRQGTLHTLNGLTEKFGVFVVDGIIDGSIRPLDPSVAAQLVSAMINAVAELPLWARGVTEQTVAALFARPLFLGIGCQTLPDKG